MMGIGTQRSHKATQRVGDMTDMEVTWKSIISNVEVREMRTNTTHGCVQRRTPGEDRAHLHSKGQL